MSHLLLEQNKTVAKIILNRPEKLNAMNIQVLNELKSLIGSINNNSSLRAVVLTGSGEKAFCAGGDIKEMSTMSPEDAMALSALAEEVTTSLEALTVPVIAALNGVALGGGLELAMACDFIYASKNAKLGLPEVNLGLIPGFGGCIRLPRYVGLARAREMVYSAEILTAQQAYELGLCNQVFATIEELNEAVLKKTELFAQKSQMGVAVAKSVLHKSNSINEGLWIERKGYGQVFAHSDSKKGITQFLTR